MVRIIDYGHYEHLVVDIESQVAVVTINRPRAMNSANARLHWELSQIWSDIDKDPAVNVGVVTGSGDRAFSAGGDIKEAEERQALDANAKFGALIDEMTIARDFVYAMVNCYKPIISAINGIAVGSGLALALLADISIINEDARLTDGHLRLGVAAGDHAAMIWPLLCGMARAKYYLLTSNFIDGREAERIGLVTKAVPSSAVLSTAMEIARDLAEGPQPALRMTKRALNQWLRFGGIASFDYSLALEMLNFFSDDPGAGLDAVLHKKIPCFPSGGRRAPGGSE